MFIQLVRLISILGLICSFFAWHATTHAAAYAVSTTQTTCPATITFGETFDCTLTTTIETDSYTFNAATNDKIFFRVLRTAGSFSPRIRVLDTNSNIVCQADAYNAARTGTDCAMTTSGSFVIRISDQYSSHTGDYKVYAQRINGVGSATKINFGDIISGSLGTTIESDAFTFDAEKNDKIILRLARESGTFSPSFTVYDANGNLVCEDSAYNAALASFEPCVISNQGTYSMLIDDQYLAATGDYKLHFQRQRKPGKATPLTYGVSLSGSLDFKAELDAFTFDANTSDTLLVRLVRDTGSYSPRFRIYDGDGDKVCEDSAYNAAIAFNDACAITESGNYSILIDDQYVAATGNYTLHIQRINNPDTVVSLKFGQTLPGTIETVGSIDTYTVNAIASDSFKLTMQRVTGAFEGRIRVFKPGGELVCTNRAYGAPTVEIAKCTAEITGRYVVIVDDFSFAKVGNYTLTLGCLNTSCGPPPPAPDVRPALYLPMLQ